MLNDFLNGLTSFLLIDRVLFDNVLTTIIYGIYIYIGIKNGVEWLSLIIGYLFIGLILTFAGISSYLNLVSVITDFIIQLLDAFNPF